MPEADLSNRTEQSDTLTQLAYTLMGRNINRSSQNRFMFFATSVIDNTWVTLKVSKTPVQPTSPTFDSCHIAYYSRISIRLRHKSRPPAYTHECLHCHEDSERGRGGRKAAADVCNKRRSSVPFRDYLNL